MEQARPRVGDSSQNSISTDPLLEQSRSIAPLRPRAGERRQRRFSDADTDSSSNLPTLTELLAIRAKDGSHGLASSNETLPVSNATQPEPPQSPALEQHTCSSAICAVGKVFETTELLELILSFLETNDVLSLRQTSRNWNLTIQDSPHLCLHFFTYGQWCRPGAEYQLLPINLPGLTIEPGKELHLGRWIKVSFTHEAARRISPDPKPNRRVRARSIFEGLRGGLGSKSQKSGDAWPASKATPTISSTLRYEDLYITQPPLLGMQAFVMLPRSSSASTIDISQPACAKLSCDAGITLGLLAETAQGLLKKYQQSGPSDAKDAFVVFKAIMSFCAPEHTPRKRSTHPIVTPLTRT